MAVGTTKSYLRIKHNRHWEDYESLKKHFGHSGLYLREYMFDGTQTATDTAAEVVGGHGEAVTFLGANDIIYLYTEADDANQDGKSVWMDYVSSTGVLYESVETKLDSVTSTATKVPIGCESGTYIDAVAAVNGQVLTMTNLDRTVTDDLAGWYVVGSGDATDQEGAYLTILSNTAAAPTLITISGAAPNANWAADNVSVQQTLNNDVFRIRRMWCEVETLAAKAILAADFNAGNHYACIADTNSYGNAGSRYFSLSDDYRCFLGKVHIEGPQSFGADTDDLNYSFAITFTPKAMANQVLTHSGTKDGAASDITITKEFIDVLHWEPCIELEPHSDVIFKINKVQAQEYAEVSLDYTVLEVTIA